MAKEKGTGDEQLEVTVIAPALPATEPDSPILPAVIQEAEVAPLDSVPPPVMVNPDPAPAITPPVIAVPAHDPYATLYDRLTTLFMVNQAKVQSIEVVEVDPDGRGGKVMLVGESAADVRYAGHLLIHEHEAANWAWLGDGPLVEEQLRFALLHCHQL